MWVCDNEAFQISLKSKKEWMNEVKSNLFTEWQQIKSNWEEKQTTGKENSDFNQVKH